MSRIQQTFKSLRRRREKALVLFMTAGDPSLKKNLELLPHLEKEGVDLVELGIPFSDPLADGPVIQASSQRALQKKTTLTAILGMVRQARASCAIPLVLMGYYNPIFRYGDARFVRDARKAGVDGVIVPDLPIEESREFSALCRRAGLDLIQLVAPTSGPERKRRIAAQSRGFVYYVSLTGVTGVKRALPAELSTDVRALKKMTQTPVCVGFGISEPEQAKALAKVADGVIIGSAFVKALHARAKAPAASFARQFVRPFASALGKASHA